MNIIRKVRFWKPNLILWYRQDTALFFWGKGLLWASIDPYQKMLFFVNYLVPKYHQPEKYLN